MQIGYRAVGSEGSHQAGRQLLENMYTANFGSPVPPIAVTSRGKPYFTQGDVHFSISHTQQMAFCVLSSCPVGIDAEKTDRNIRLELADKILSDSEKRRYQQAPDKRDFLLRLWVLKEAEAKSTGQGLQGYPNHTDFHPDDPRILQIQGHYVAVIERKDYAV